MTIAFLFFYLAGSASAQVEITEIMYNLEGGDSGREWIELRNTGIESVDLYSWRFFEADSNHKIYTEKGGDVIGLGSYIEPNSYVILSNAVDVFMLDHSSYSGIVYYSSFSLHNTGELLIIRDSELNDIDPVTYSSEWGANGDGNSLQKVNGSWCAGTPTPGAENISIYADSPDDDPSPSGDDEDEPDNESTQEQEPPATYSDTMPSWAEEPKISTYAGARKRIIVAGASIDFKGQSRGADGEPLQFARYIWSFGDGACDEGKEITHTYYYPGEYVVVLNTASGRYATMDRVVVKVISANIVITNVSFDDPSFIEIHNKTSYELDLSQWQLKAGKQIFTIPQDTFIKPKKKIVFPSQVTELFIKKGDKVTFLYPSGDIVASYSAKENIPAPVNKDSNETQTTQPASDYVKEKVVTKDTAYNNLFPHNTVKSEGSSILGYVDIEENEEAKPAAAESFGVVKPAAARSYGEVKEELITPDIDNTAQVANVLSETESRKSNKEDGLFWGIMGVSLISLIAIYGVLISKEKENPVQAEDEVSLYKIIEIED